MTTTAILGIVIAVAVIGFFPLSSTLNSSIVGWLWHRRKKIDLSSRKPILILTVTVVLLITGVLYLKNYRLEYCKAKFSTGDFWGRSHCISEPLYKFIF